MSDLDVQNINSKTGNSAISISDSGCFSIAVDFVLASGTTAERPSSPAGGTIRFNSDLGYIEYYDDINAAWEGTGTSGE